MRRSRRLIAAAIVLAQLVLVAGCAAALHRQQPPVESSSPASSAAPLPLGSSTQQITVDGDVRTYRVYVPDQVTDPSPVVLMLHGGYGTGAQAERAYGWDELADSEHVIVAFPDAVGRAWNSGGGCCGTAARTGTDDVAFLTAVVADLKTRIPVDTKRVYAAGMSNGAMMAYRLACDTTVFAAIGAVAGTIAPETRCESPAPLSVMAVNGTADTRVLYDGGISTVGSARIEARPAPEIAAFWRRVDHCPDPTVTSEPPLTTASAQCPEGRAVTLVTVEGYGHEWPATAGSQTPYGETVYTGWDATTQLWQFFAAHPQP